MQCVATKMWCNCGGLTNQTVGMYNQRAHAVSNT